MELLSNKALSYEKNFTDNTIKNTVIDWIRGVLLAIIVVSRYVARSTYFGRLQK